MDKRKIAMYVALAGAMTLLSGCKKEEARTLDEANPIPAYEGSLNLESHYSRRLGIDVMVPEGMTVTEDAKMMTVKGDHYEVTFLPTDKVELETVAAEVSSRKNLEGYKDVDIKTTSLSGHEAKAMIYNVKEGKSNNHPSFCAAIDYEGKEKSDADGLIITVKQDDQRDAYELLNDEKVLALLQNVEILQRGSLDQEQPLPKEEESPEVREELHVENRLKLQIPEGFSVTGLEDGILVSDEEGYETAFIQVNKEGLTEERTLLDEKYKDENYYHTEKIGTTWQGYPADAYIFSVTEDAGDHPTFELVVDYKDVSVAGNKGLIIRSDYQGDLDAYDLLKNQGLLTLMNQAEVITGDGLDKEVPLPASDGNVDTAEYETIAKRLLLQIPEGMKAEETEEQVVLSGVEGLKIMLTPVSSLEDLDAETSAYEQKVNAGELLEPASAEVLINGYKAAMQIYNEAQTQEAELKLVVPYDGAVVGSYAGLVVQATMEKPVYAYDLLKDQSLLTVLEKLDILEGDTQSVYECNGIRAEFPSRYTVLESDGEQGLSAFYEDFSGQSISIQMNPASGNLENVPFKRLSTVFDDLNEITYGEVLCMWRYDEQGDGMLHVYRPYGVFRTLDVAIGTNQEDAKEWLEAVLTQDDFVTTMETTTVTPEYLKK